MRPAQLLVLIKLAKTKLDQTSALDTVTPPTCLQAHIVIIIANMNNIADVRTTVPHKKGESRRGSLAKLTRTLVERHRQKRMAN
jgi:hypothetical protein